MIRLYKIQTGKPGLLIGDGETLAEAILVALAEDHFEHVPIDPYGFYPQNDNDVVKYITNYINENKDKYLVLGAM